MNKMKNSGHLVMLFTQYHCPVVQIHQAILGQGWARTGLGGGRKQNMGMGR